MPPVAIATLPGTGNLCILVDGDIESAKKELSQQGVEPVSPTNERDGASGPVISFHIHDPDGNLVEIAQRI